MVSIGIVIPAHDEQRTIERSLHALAGLAGDVALVVVCNGCTDDTATTARAVAPWASVVEIPQASKPAALNAGDAAIDVLTRLYLDADVLLSAGSVRRLAEVLVADRLAAVAPTPRYEVRDASAIVRSHYRIWVALNTSVNAIYGTGAMMLSDAARSRFGEWPDLIADDYFLDGLFGDAEKRRLNDVGVVVILPRRFGACVSRKARVHEGKRQVQRLALRSPSAESAGAGSALLRLLRSRPTLLVDVPAHVLITLSARSLSAWRRWRRTAHTFYRDPTSRQEWTENDDRSLTRR